MTVEARPTQGMLAARRDMIEEALHIVDAARQSGVVLRLFGGLALCAHFELAHRCERDHSDIDLIGLHRQYKELPGLFAQLGYKENVHVRQATRNKQLQFYRRCNHPDAELHYFIHPNDHVDVFLDAFRMDHEVPLSERLEIEEYTISLSDMLLTKLQAAHIGEKDELDVIGLLSQVPLGETDKPGVVNTTYIVGLCARQWGLYHDVQAGIAQIREVLATRDDLEPPLAQRVRSSLDRLAAAVGQEPKSRRWRLRAKVGTHEKWREAVEEQEAKEHGPPIPPGSSA